MKRSEFTDKKRLIRAVSLAVVAAFSYTFMTLLVKFAADNTSASMIVFSRFSLSLLWVVIILTFKHLRGRTITIKSKHPWLHLLRAVCGFVAISTLYFALGNAPLVEVNSLALTYALFIPVLGYIFLKIKTNYKSWAALFGGFVGILLIIKPYFGSFNPLLLFALVSAIATATSFLTVYKLAKYDHPYTLMIYYFLLSCILSGIYVAFNWQTPSLTALLYLLSIGVIGTLYQELLTRALTYASPKIISPILYLSIVFSGFLDWIFWSAVPDLYFWIGVCLVSFGCIFSIRHTNPKE